ncbi:membrane protein insertase YidC [Chelatococcus sambhunathii]|nr:membrane protein insertase YidC [Chelatococcus sambhunathii]
MDNRNTILAVALSIMVLIGWQYFFARPQIEAQRQQQATQAALNADKQAGETPGAGAPQPGAPAPSAAGAPQGKTRDEALKASPRVKIDSPRLDGSIALVGGRIDDVSLKDYRETVDPKSPEIVLFAPLDSPQPYYAEFGFVNAQGGTAKLPDGRTEWKAESAGPLTDKTPVVLTWDNGEGLIFKRTISLDANYMFTVKDSVTNAGSAAATLYPYALISRRGEPHVSGYYILHEGLIGVIGDEGLQELTYKKVSDGPRSFRQNTGGWLGITDKYWASALVPPQDKPYDARFASTTDGGKTYQTDYLLNAMTIAPGASAETSGRLFAGAKQVSVIDKYETEGGVRKFELMIDWGWFHFITKPMFYALDYFFKLLGNFGLAILAVTVIVKLLFFPLANKSYVSMSKMKLVQPEMAKIKERFPDDKVKQQQELMELYKKEKINPLAGCLPIVIQIPVFFSLYKVLFVTIEMRHAPFYGWIRDLAAPDPTSLFNLFGLIPWEVPHFLLIGVWPILMGITMFLQMRLNPAPPDPTQAMIFNWMPLFFTFLLASFPAGLVIYWTWNNLLSILQQWVIMKRQGVKVDILGNTLDMFKKKPADAPKT